MLIEMNDEMIEKILFAKKYSNGMEFLDSRSKLFGGYLRSKGTSFEKYELQSRTNNKFLAHEDGRYVDRELKAAITRNQPKKGLKTTSKMPSDSHKKSQIQTIEYDKEQTDLASFYAVADRLGANFNSLIGISI